MKASITRWGATLAFLTIAAATFGKGFDRNRVVANPIDLDYAFTHIHRQGGREAADPVIVPYHDRYYLFVSMSYGYWSSSDLQHWRFITNDILPFSRYAPAAMVYRDELYFMGGFDNRLFKTSTPEDGNSWVVASDSLCPYPDNPQRAAADPYLFVDDDERVYLYWGCSMTDPIMGVELDPAQGFRGVGRPVALIQHCEKTFGWERRGNNNETDEPSSNEGPAMLKRNGLYYLQYAAPGTEFDCYGDGLYTSRSPLGPFEHHPASPFSLKPGGWMTGAGHGDTFRDRHGNWWHVASTVICQRFLMERRIALWPLYFTDDGFPVAVTHIGDEPFVVPDRAVDFQHNPPTTGWADLGRGKHIQASSETPQHPAAHAADNSIKTWWSAATGQPGEWLCIDLGRTCRIEAVQPNFADEDFGMFRADEPKTPYRYTVEASTEGVSWHTVIDRSDATDTRPHPLLVLPRSARCRFVRLVNQAPLCGRFSAFDLRIFGHVPGAKPSPVRGIHARRGSDSRRISLTWQSVAGATGYVVRWGIDPGQLHSACQTSRNQLELGVFTAGQPYYFRVDALNENGSAEGAEVIGI